MRRDFLFRSKNVSLRILENLFYSWSHDGPIRTNLMKDVKTRKESSWIDLFLSVIRAAYLGERFTYKDRTFNLDPTLVAPYDFSRKIRRPSNDYEELLASLDPNFKDAARAEVYRRRKGWVAQGLQGYHGIKIRRVKVDKNIFLLPVLSDRKSVGVDTSSIEQKIGILAFCFIADYEAAYVYLGRHLGLPKTHNREEFKWTKLNWNFRARVLERFKLLLSISCDAILVIETDAIISPIGKFENLFKNLVEGCFSGYERDPAHARLRPVLRKKFLQLANDVQVHCDKDFRHLAPDKAVKLFVQTLAKRDGWYEEYTPLFAPLRSHESKPIQLADIFIGIIKTKIQNNEPLDPLTPLAFDRRKIAGYKGRYVKPYYWFS